MELNVCEAVKNNVLGTKRVAEACARRAVERFILISTDKAVNPSSVMGVTKRIAELTIQTMVRRSDTSFAAVRFGNVLGSNGSVVPRFLEQIRAGGPVTVTHPEMRRYFMLISEAVQLVLHAATLDEQGAIYVLDMGEQIKLVDMARNLIRLSGFVPDEEIAIRFIGPRPGEKLFEELVGLEEIVEPAGIEKILKVESLASCDREDLAVQLSILERMALQGKHDDIVVQLARIVPAFHREPIPAAVLSTVATAPHLMRLTADAGFQV
jgi:FlaA1/EpsC-like NDP-sugar epimerase